jgi:hypothetical protein
MFVLFIIEVDLQDQTYPNSTESKIPRYFPKLLGSFNIEK